MTRRTILHLIIILCAALALIALWLSNVFGQVTPAQFKSWYPNFGRYLFPFIHYIVVLKPALQALLVISALFLIGLNKQRMHYLWHPNARQLVMVIPELRWGSLVPPQSTPGLLQNTPYHIPALTPQHYNANDGHYNETGHKIHAETIMQLLN